MYVCLIYSDILLQKVIPIVKAEDKSLKYIATLDF